jgi:protein-glutamine gamma-glutamyltransferase
MMELHRRLGALLALLALMAFVSGAGLEAPAVVPAALVLLAAVFVQPGERWSSRLEPAWRIAALLLAARAALRVVTGAGDPVLPMVDLLLLLLCAESLRSRDGSGDARHFALTFALLIASAAYRPGPLFALLFAAYVVSATVMLVVGHLLREARRHNAEAPPPARPFLLRVAALSTVVLATSFAVFLFFPRVSEGWASRGAPAMSRAMVGFGDRVSLGQHGTRIEPNPEVVMRIEFPGGAPGHPTGLHWRGRSYNQFDGVAWSSRPDVRGRDREAELWGGPVIEQVVYARALGGANVLFGLHPVAQVDPLSRIRPVRMRNGDFLYVGDGDPAYRVRSAAGRPTAEQLRQVEPEHTPEYLAHLQLPAVTPRLLRLADSLRTSAPTMYDHVRAVERYLTTQFDYTLDLPPTRREATLDHFIFVRRAGHCEYFSTAMAVLLRAGGVASRNVNGFLGGEWNDFGQYLTVTQNNAHSWVEVFFPGLGWVAFDPTPPAAVATIAGGAGGLSRWRMFRDGMDHRWSRWVLDYDVGVQSSVFQRLASPFTPSSPGGAESVEARRPLWPAAAAAALLLMVLFVAHRIRRARRLPAGPAARAYLEVRRAYERAGFPPATAQPPLAFAAALQSMPGTEDARQVVAAYVAVRFGGRELGAGEAARLQEAARRARTGVRA